MADERKVDLDQAQVKKAVQALQAYLKTKSTPDSLLLDDTQHISLLFTFWKIPNRPQTIRIPLPHGQRSETDEVCLFTRDEPKMNPEQNQKFYKKLLEQRGVKNVTEIIPYATLRKEYKPFEAKRRLLGNFDLFLSDDRIRRLLPSHIGKHFYERKKEPMCVNLESKHLARDIQSLIQGTNIKITNKGPCCMVRVAPSGMAADQVTENIEAAVQAVAAKMLTKGPLMKIIHIKTETSVALPIYTSKLSNLDVLEEAQKSKRKPKKEKTKQTDTSGEGEEKKVEDDEEIPQLVPIATPSKKAKLEKPPKKKKQLKKSPKPAAAKKRPRKMAKKARKTDSKVKRKVPKVK